MMFSIRSLAAPFAMALGLLLSPVFAFAVSMDDVTKEHEARWNALLGKRYENELVQSYVARVGQRLVDHCDACKGQDYTFLVVDDDLVNAEAMMGNRIVVYRGLLTLMKSEAELASVIGHEISHITEDHMSRRVTAMQTADIGSALLGIATAIGTGSGMAGSAVQDTTRIAGAAVVSGYGRDMELEADHEGATLMHAAGYPPEAMIDMLGSMKDYENFMRLKAKDAGQAPRAYHGTFSSHPRNDQRLKEAVAAAGELAKNPDASKQAESFREAMEGLKFSEEDRASAVVDNRYYNAKLDFTLAYPSNWKVVPRGSSVIAGVQRDKTFLQMKPKRADATVPPEQLLRDMVSARNATLGDGEEITGTAIQGYMGTTGDPADGSFRRLAVIYYGSNAYHFEGRTGNVALLGLYDTLFKSSIASFRPMNGADRNAVLGIDIHYVKAVDGTTFAGLASESPLPKYAEEQLRVINGYYPRGEPQAGEWIKIFR